MLTVSNGALLLVVAEVVGHVTSSSDVTWSVQSWVRQTLNGWIDGASESLDALLVHEIFQAFDDSLQNSKLVRFCVTCLKVKTHQSEFLWEIYNFVDIGNLKTHQKIWLWFVLRTSVR